MRQDQLALCLSPFSISSLREEDKGLAGGGDTSNAKRHQAFGQTMPPSPPSALSCTHCCYTCMKRWPGRETLLSPCVKQIHSVNSPKSAHSLSVNWINKVYCASEWLQQAVTHTVMFVYTEQRQLCKQPGSRACPNLSISSLFHLLTHTFLNTWKRAGV